MTMSRLCIRLIFVLILDQIIAVVRHCIKSILFMMVINLGNEESYFTTLLL